MIGTVFFSLNDIADHIILTERVPKFENAKQAYEYVYTEMMKESVFLDSLRSDARRESAQTAAQLATRRTIVLSRLAELARIRKIYFDESFSGLEMIVSVITSAFMARLTPIIKGLGPQSMIILNKFIDSLKDIDKDVDLKLQDEINAASADEQLIN